MVRYPNNDTNDGANGGIIIMDRQWGILWLLASYHVADSSDGLINKLYIISSSIRFIQINVMIKIDDICWDVNNSFSGYNLMHQS